MKVAAKAEISTNSLIKTFCLIISLLAFGASPLNARIAISIAVFFFILFCRKSDQAQLSKQIGFCLGFTLTFFESLGGYPLLSFAACLALFDQAKITFKKIPFKGFLVLIAIWIVVRFFTDYSIEHIQQAIAQGALQELFAVGVSSSNSTLLKIFYFSNYFLLSLFLLAFASQVEMRKAFLRGLNYGVPIAVILSIYQIIEPRNFLMNNTNSFWIGTGRTSGSFSDPNSFGVCAALILPLLISSQENGLKLPLLRLSGLLGLTLLAFFSGSRTFVLILAIYIISAAFKAIEKTQQQERESSQFKNKFWLFAFTGCLLAGCLFLYFAQNPALSRSLAAFNIYQLKETIFSRSVFWRADLNLFKQNPIFGVGFNDFRLYLPESLKQLGININGWSDNPNSFYLAILTELGIVGALLLIYGLSQLQFKKFTERSSLTARLSLSGLIIALFFGPHFEFTEVAILSTFILAENFDLKLDSPSVWHKRATHLTIIAFLSIFIIKAVLSNEGGYFISGRSLWLKGNARLTLNCDSLNQAGFILANDHSFSTIGFKVITGNNQQIITDHLRPKERKKFSINCSGDQKKIFIKYKANQLATKKLGATKKDQRWLSLRLSKL
ncbi:MAG TPA: O-antigen ligase family protein [Oligoflexia bacterium]|nr:O-antigen ligase family protein [Oligoflexia bacterium]HMP27839.1 O-antigen ligase family protein [Oligoflexia bacterium]